MLTSFIGLGYYGTITPAVILRNVLENPAWYTAYTPYQPEISQGRLEALLNFQTMVSDLTGSPSRTRRCSTKAPRRPRRCAAASARRKRRRGRVLRRRRLSSADDRRGAHARRRRSASRSSWPTRRATRRDATASGCSCSIPAADGEIVDYRALIAKRGAEGRHVVVAADLLALTLLAPPGELGADVAVGSTQRFGVPMGFGGRTPPSSRARRAQAQPAGPPRRRVTVDATATRRTASRCRRASSTSAARRRRRTSAPRRCCSR